MIGIDPELNDPENGDYSLSQNSPAIGYGCQTFLTKVNKNIYTPKNIIKRDVVEDMIWDADTVYVSENIDILSGSTLYIEPGVTVIFEDYYHLNIYGRLISEGTSDSFITFTAANPNQFELDSTTTGSWNGINFFDINTSENDSSIIKYSIFEYSKRVSSKDIYNFIGGAISLFNSSNVTIVNNIFQNNLSYFGGAIGCIYDSSPRIMGNIIRENYAIKNGSAISSFYSFPDILNNTIVDNTILEDDPFYESSTIYNFISKPKFQNNIIRYNVSNYGEIIYNKLFYTWNNNIQNFTNSGTNGNIDLDPEFSNINSLKLSSNSPCINTGKINNDYNHNFDFPNFDLFGEIRIIDEIIDIGANEFNPEVNSNDYEFTIMNCELKQNYPNPFNPLTKINYTLAQFSDNQSIEIVVYNSTGQEVWSSGNLPFTIHNSPLYFDGSKFNSGIYYYSLFINDKKMDSKSMLLIK